MLRRPLHLGLVCLFGLLSIEHAAEAAEVAPGPLGKVFAAADKASDQNDCAGVVQQLRPHLEDPALATYPAEVQASVFDMTVRCEETTGKAEDAYRDTLIGTHIDAASDDLWKQRLALEIDAKKHEAAVITIEAMSNGRGAALNAIPSRWLIILDRQMKDKQEMALRRRLLAILTAPVYQSTEPTSPLDNFRRSYAELLFDAGEQAQALTVARQISHPSILLEFSVDPRFRTLLPADFDGRAGAERYVQEMQALSVLHPEALDPVLEEAQWLVQLGRAQEALDLLLKARPLGQKGQQYEDLQEKLNWWWDSIARARVALNQYDEAIAAFRQGGQVQESGALNVSQVLNLAEAQLNFGRPRDTLATLEAFSATQHDVSGYGLMVYHYNHGCALAQLGETTKLAADLDYIRAHATESRGILRNMLLCTGDLDGAAKAFIDDLGTPDHRADALLDLSDYDPSPPGTPMGPVGRQLSALKKRADIRAAIARAGGIRHFRLQRGWN